jgi:hypothetical protein
MRRRSGIAAILYEGLTIRDPFESEADTCFAIEHELHQVITPEYSVAKYQVQGEMLEELAKRMKKKSTSKPTTMGMGGGQLV